MKKIIYSVLLQAIILFSSIQATKACSDGSTWNPISVTYNPCGTCGGMATIDWIVCNAVVGATYQFSITYSGGAANGGSFVYTPTGNCQSGTTSVFVGTFKTIFNVDLVKVTLPSCFVTINLATPVTLTSFKPTLIDKHVAVEWSTAQEQNAQLFEVEKSVDGKTFTSIGSVDAQGNSSVENKYLFVDDNINAHTLYYRLKQLDINGKFIYSQTQRVNCEFLQPQISCYPNPCNMFLSISLNSTENSLIEIYSLDGRKLKSEQTNSLTHTINVESLSKGTYLLRVSNSEKTYTSKFVRQ